MFVPKEEAPDRRFFLDGTALARVFQEAPYLARCSDNKTAARVRPRDHAIRYPYMQINRPGMVSWLIFDHDHSNAWKWQDVGLPPPNLIVRDRTSGKSHSYYAIPPVCTTEAARAKPIQFMKSVYAAMAAALDADPSYHSGPVAKTPGHPWWQTTELHNKVYDLSELAEYVELEWIPPWGKKVDLDDVSHSRHVMLFTKLRYYAYSIVNRERADGSLHTFTRYLEAYAHNSNNFTEYGYEQKLPQSSLRATVRSVSRWTWENYRGAGNCHRGVMQLSPDLPLPERQSLAAKRTATKRNQATESKIRGACTALTNLGRRITQVAVAAWTKLSRQTVAKHMDILRGDAPAAVVDLASIAKKKISVKLAAHQIPAVSLQAGSSVSYEAGVDVQEEDSSIRDG